MMMLERNIVQVPSGFFDGLGFAGLKAKAQTNYERMMLDQVIVTDSRIIFAKDWPSLKVFKDVVNHCVHPFVLQPMAHTFKYQRTELADWNFLAVSFHVKMEYTDYDSAS